jgi:hypothetical protein
MPDFPILRRATLASLRDLEKARFSHWAKREHSDGND